MVFQFFFMFVFVMNKLDVKFYYNVTLYKSFINKVYDLVGQPSYFSNIMLLSVITLFIDSK